MINYVIDPFPRDEDLVGLWLSAWGTPGPATFTNILSRSLAHVGAYNDKALIGYVNLAWDGGVHAFILDTCVHQDWQRRGVGTSLVGTAVEEARRKGMHWLHVDFEERLSSFYEGCGFRETSAGLLRL